MQFNNFISCLYFLRLAKAIDLQLLNEAETIGGKESSNFFMGELFLESQGF